MSTSLFQDWSAFMEHLQQAGFPVDMEPNLKMMLAMARSRADLCRLHNNVFEADFRLCSSDFQAFERIWLDHFKSENPKKITLFTGEVAYFLLNYGMGTGKLGGYYTSLIRKAAKKIYHVEAEMHFKQWENVVYSRTGRFGFGQYHYRVKMFGYDFEMACYRKGQRAWVFLKIMSTDLSEALTHKLTSELPEFELMSSHFDVNRGAVVELIFHFGDISLENYIEVGPPSRFNGPPTQIGTQTFIQTLCQSLVNIGVPITQVEIL